MISRLRLFQKSATAIFIVFLGMMIFVAIVAHARPSGSTRQDMAQGQLLRKKVEEQIRQTRYSENPNDISP